MTASVKAL
jgi:hypothetical protein